MSRLKKRLKLYLAFEWTIQELEDIASGGRVNLNDSAKVKSELSNEISHLKDVLKKLKCTERLRFPRGDASS